jgi:hypothetical protein
MSLEGRRDCAVAALAPPFDPAGCIRGDVISAHQVTIFGDRARQRDGHCVHCIQRRVLVGLREDRAERPAGPRGEARCTESVVRACEPADDVARVASAVGAREQTPLPVSRERTPRWSSLMLMCSALALERRVLVGLLEDRAERPAGPERPDARSPWFASATVRTTWRVSRLPSARRSRRRCPCRVSARCLGRDVATVAFAVGAMWRRRCPCRVSARLGGRAQKKKRAGSGERPVRGSEALSVCVLRTTRLSGGLSGLSGGSCRRSARSSSRGRARRRCQSPRRAPRRPCRCSR